MPEDLGSNPQEDIQYMIEPPRDLHELYMRTRAQLSSSKSFYNYYMKMLSVVDIGSKLLPGQYKEFSDEVSDFLASEGAYPGKRQMEESGNSYRMGTDSTGLIVVAKVDLQAGLRETLEQQTARIIPKLKRYDDDILRVLIGEGIVDTKRPILEDLLIDQTMSELSEMISKRRGGSDDR